LDNRDGVAVAIRALLVSALDDAWRRGERLLLIGHSLGSVIAYDCLWELSRSVKSPVRVDQFVTLGSPLATRFIRTALKGVDRPPPERYPANVRRWANFSARGELVAVHPRLEPYFDGMVECGLIETIEDHAELYTHFHDATGINPHRSYGYLIHADVAGLIGDWLSA
jgi:pimeloyl-ACP methyl ester carboxylesterase